MFSESVHLASSWQDGVGTLRWTGASAGLEEGAAPPLLPPGPMLSLGDVAAPGGHEAGHLPLAVPAACPPDSSSHRRLKTAGVNECCESVLGYFC